MKKFILSLLISQCVINAEDESVDRRQMHHQTSWQTPMAPAMMAPAPVMQAAPMMAPGMYNPGYGYGAPVAAQAPLIQSPLIGGPLPANLAQPMMAPVMQPVPMMAPAPVPMMAPAPVPMIAPAPVPMMAPAPVMQPVPIAPPPMMAPVQGMQIYDHNVVSVPVHVPVEPPVCVGNTIYNSLMTSCQQCPDGTTANASRTACVLAMFCGVGEVPMSSGQGCQKCQPGTHPDPTGTFCQGPPPIEVFFAPTPQPQPQTQVTYHPEQVVTPNAVTVKHDTTYQTGAYNWNSSAQPTTHWNGASQGFAGAVAAPMGVAPMGVAPMGLPMGGAYGAPVMAGVPGMIGAPAWGY